MVSITTIFRCGEAVVDALLQLSLCLLVRPAGSPRD